MTRKEITITGLAVVVGLAAIGEGLGIWFLKTSNSNLKATGTALSGENAGCDATQAAMKGQINNLGAESTRLWGIVEIQRAQLTQMTPGTSMVIEVTRQNEITRVVTVEVTPTGLKCYPLVTATRTPTETNTATATRTKEPTLAQRNTDVATAINTRPVPTNTMVFVPTDTPLAPTEYPTATNTQVVPSPTRVATQPEPSSTVPSPTNTDTPPTRVATQPAPANP